MSDKEQIEMVRRSLLHPEMENIAKKLLLKDIYKDVTNTYTGTASNGGKLADLPKCVNEYLNGEKNEPCREDMEFSYNAIRVLMARYLATLHGKLSETPSMLMIRVATAFGKYTNKEKLINLLLSRRFMFNSPTLFNMFINGAKGTLSACYVTPIYDDMTSIMNGTEIQALTFKFGGGQGFSFSNLRPRWSIVKGTGSYSSGPLSFMRIYDSVTDSVKQGGKRRGANMGIMHVWHPDIYNPYFDPISAYRFLLPQPEKKLLSKIKELIDEIEKDGYEVNDEIKKILSETKETTPEDAGFIQAKESILSDSFLTNFNISVGINDAFMKAVIENKDWIMITPQVSGETTGKGDYKLHYTYSKETGDGIIGELVRKYEWIKKNPFVNEFEEVMQYSIPKAKKMAEKSKCNTDIKNPYIWKQLARKIWDKIIKNTWKGGDPGVLFIDNHNKWNPTPWLGIVVATNPCISSNTLILTKNGWKTAKELYEEGKKSGIVKAVLVGEKALGKGGDIKAYPVKLISVNDNNKLELLSGNETNAWVWYVGRKDGVRVKTKEEYEITVTKEHKFLTPNGWKEAYSLKPGEKILISKLSPDTYKNIEGISINEDIAFLLGWIVGNEIPNDYYGGFYFSNKESKVMEKVLKGLEELGMKKPERHIIKRESETIILIQEKIYKKILDLLGENFANQHERSIPRKVWMFNFNTLRAFLKGLFTANGRMDKDKAIRLNSASLSLLKEVQILLTGLGIYSKIYEIPHKRKFVYITKDGEKKEYESKKYYELVISNYSRKLFMKLIGFEDKNNNTKVTLMETKIDSPWATVEEIEEVKDVEFYDFTVPQLHNYIANGIVNHNCGEQYLYPFESCNLGSISIEKYINNGKFNLEEFSKDVEVIIDAMDSIIDENKHPDVRQTKANIFTRKIGLGIMGLADALVKLGYPYDSEKGVAFTLIITASLEVLGWKRSWELGKIRGPAPAFECKIWDWRKMRCKEKGNIDEIIELHTPSLIKAGKIIKINNEWVELKYHDVNIPLEIFERFNGEAKNRIEKDGKIKLVKTSALIEVLQEVFGISPQMYTEMKNLSLEKVINNPKYLVTLGIFNPKLLWNLFRIYGKKIGTEAPRNTTITTVAPTGSISIIAGTSSGIEPYFALVYKRKVTIGEFLEVVSQFREKIIDLSNKYKLDEATIEKIFNIISNNKGSLRNSLTKIKELLNSIITDENKTVNLYNEIEKLAKLFPISIDFDVWYHIAHQAASQLYVDQSISKTVNLPKDASINDVFTVYFGGWIAGLKGVTIYRDESKTTQVIYFGDKEREKIVKKKDNHNGNGSKFSIMRMTIPKEKMKYSEVKNDLVLLNVASLKENNGEVVMEMEENSTCKTCHL